MATIEFEEFVYVVLCPETGLRKIGMTINIPQRFSQLQGDSAYPLDRKGAIIMGCPAQTAKLFEQHLHDRFRSKRTHGEWFKLDATDMEYFAKDPVVVIELRQVTLSPPMGD